MVLHIPPCKEDHSSAVTLILLMREALEELFGLEWADLQEKGERKRRLRRLKIFENADPGFYCQ
jgi:hypothetical protein